MLLNIRHASLAALAVVAGLAGSTSEDESVYRDARYGLSIVPPAFEDDGEAPAVTIAMFQAPPVDGFSANMNLQRQAFSEGLEAYVAMSARQFAAAKLEVHSSKSTQVGERAAHEFVYSGEVVDRDLKFHALAIEDGEHVLLVTCTALEESFGDYAKEFAASLASLKLDD